MHLSIEFPKNIAVEVQISRKRPLQSALLGANPARSGFNMAPTGKQLRHFVGALLHRCMPHKNGNLDRRLRELRDQRTE
jgi:hypothetical protein